MAKFTGFITGRERGFVRDRIGQRYSDKVTVEAGDKDQAKGKVKDTLLPGERLVYIGPGEKGHKLPPARG